MNMGRNLVIYLSILYTEPPVNAGFISDTYVDIFWPRWSWHPMRRNGERFHTKIQNLSFRSMICFAGLLIWSAKVIIGLVSSKFWWLTLDSQKRKPRSKAGLFSICWSFYCFIHRPGSKFQVGICGMKINQTFQLDEFGILAWTDLIPYIIFFWFFFLFKFASGSAPMPAPSS